MIKIQFTKHYQSYVIGKVVSFNKATAKGLVKLGVAKLYTEKVEKSQYENKMDNLYYSENKGL